MCSKLYGPWIADGRQRAKRPAANESRSDTKGDLFEYMLSKIATAGQNGQFRTTNSMAS